MQSKGTTEAFSRKGQLEHSVERDNWNIQSKGTNWNIQSKGTTGAFFKLVSDNHLMHAGTNREVTEIGRSQNNENASEF